MKILNTHDEVIDIECDRCRQPLNRDKHGYYMGVIVVELISMKDKHYCSQCGEFLKQSMEI